MKAASLVVILIISAACGRDEEITRMKVPKEEVSGAPGETAPPHATPAAGLKWTTPKGWTETGASGMRRATIVPPGPGKAEATVIAFPGDAGGELANVNRWRQQIGLPPFAEDGLAAARARVASPAGGVSVYRFESADGKTRVAAGALFSGGMTWFFKLSGDAAAVKAAEPAFDGLLGTLRAAR